MAKVLAGIVLYNSDFPRLLECLAGLENQVESIIVWDNSPQEYSALEREKFASIEIVNTYTQMRIWECLKE